MIKAFLKLVQYCKICHHVFGSHEDILHMYFKLETEMVNKVRRASLNMQMRRMFPEPIESPYFQKAYDGE